MDIDPVRLSTALQDLYAATLDPSERASLPHRIAAAFGAPSCLMHMRSRNAADVAIVGRTENLASLMPAYVEERYASDVWSEAASARRSGKACFGEEIVPEKELLASDWYNELCRPTRIHHLVGAVFEVAPGTNGLIGVHSPANGARFEDADRAMMQLLIPHLAQAYRLLQIADANARARRLTFEALASLSVGVFIVNAEGRVRMLNAVAERVAKIGSGIRVSNGRLLLGEPRFDDHLKAVIRSASLAPLGRSLFSGETIVARTARGVPLPLKIVPLPPDTITARPLEPLAAVFIGEPSMSAQPSMELARALYGLTPAEARVLLAVLNGERLSDYAAKAGVSINTANTQMKSIFAKTGSHRQADLVRRIICDPMLRLGLG